VYSTQAALPADVSAWLHPPRGGVPETAWRRTARSEGEVAGRKRTIGIPKPLLESLRRHKVAQDAEREHAGSEWHDGGRVFAKPTAGRSTRARIMLSGRRCSRTRGVRDARLHDARHTAATMLLVLKVPLPAIMEVMGWSEASVGGRATRPGGVFCAASTAAHRTSVEPCLVIGSRCTVVSDSRWRGVSPAHEHRCRALGNRAQPPGNPRGAEAPLLHHIRDHFHGRDDRI
jgi:hypothetical protein